MLEKSPVTKKESLMDNLLNQLDSEVSRYYNTLNEIRSSRLTIQESNTVCGNETNTPKEQLGDGILKKFDSLIERLRTLNNDAQEEARLLQEYL